jgi:hypothetical protein
VPGATFTQLIDINDGVALSASMGMRWGTMASSRPSSLRSKLTRVAGEGFECNG